MHRTDKYSKHSSIIWTVWLNGWVFVYKLTGCGFASSCSHLNQNEFGIEKVIKKKGNKLYVKWKGYDNLIVRSIKKT